MRTAVILAALVGLAAATPMPQSDFDFMEIDASKKELATGPPVLADSQPIVYNPSAAASSAAAAAATDPATPTTKLKKRDGNCAVQPAGSGPSTTPDTDSDFLANPVYTAIATNAPVPDGYSQSFSNLQGSTSAPTYMGLYTLTSYDVSTCQEKCDAATSCYGFNIYIERDPSLDPGDACPNPTSTINYKCTLWGSAIDGTTATNQGQWRNQYHVVITASNGYNKLAPPPSYPGYTGPTELGGAINAPSGYVGAKWYSGPYDPGQCIAACTATNKYDHDHPRSDSTYDPCNFVNAYVLSKDNVPQGTYCSLYTKTWGKGYDTNFGQYRGSSRYTASQSFGYTLSATDSGVVGS